MYEFSVTSPEETCTSLLGIDVSMALCSGDLILISGPLGAGKSHLARAIIKSLADNPDFDVPSPSYTLCNSYDLELPVLHCDFFRLENPQEADELGWQEALESGCVIVEWPERIFERQPDNSVWIDIVPIDATGRNITLTCRGDPAMRIQRSREIRNFLRNSGYPDCVRLRFQADASARNYERIETDENAFLLMDSPKMADGPVIKDGKTYSELAHLAESVHAFVAIDMLVRDQGFCAPEILGQDLDAGLLLIEDLGAGRIVDENLMPIKDRFFASVEMLSELHARHIPGTVKLDNDQLYTIPTYDPEAFLAETELMIRWYVPHKLGTNSEQCSRKEKEFMAIWHGLSQHLEKCKQGLVLRDFHSPNIIWQENKSGHDRIGLIDFQDAVIGPVTYDLASIAQDARVDVSESLEHQLVEHYIDLQVQKDDFFDTAGFREFYAITAAQRVTKILGIFVRLDKRDAKPAYLAHIGRLEQYLSRSLQHEILDEYRGWIHDVIKL